MELLLDDLSYTWSLVGVCETKFWWILVKTYFRFLWKPQKNFQIYHYRLIQFYKTGSIISKLLVPKLVNGSSHFRLSKDQFELLWVLCPVRTVRGRNSDNHSLRFRRLFYLNSHDRRRLYLPRYEVAVYCQVFYYGVFDAYRLKLTYVFLVPKKFDSWYNSNPGLRMSFPVNFRFISGEISTEKNFGKIVLHQKIRPWISREESWAIFELSHSFPPLSAFKTIFEIFRCKNSRFLYTCHPV